MDEYDFYVNLASFVSVYLCSIVYIYIVWSNLHAI